MDKAWMHKDRLSLEYLEGVDQFIAFARRSSEDQPNETFGDLVKISCPCKCCKNLRDESCEIIREHLIVNGIDLTYDAFVCHGEQLNHVTPSVDTPPTHDLSEDSIFQDMDTQDNNDDITCDGDINVTICDEMLEKASLYPHLKDTEPPLYYGCKKYTRLSATAVLYRLKNINGWTNNSFDKLLEVLHDMFPEDNKLPDSMSSVKDVLKEFELEYEKIDACVNDCVLFRKDLENMETCPKCHCSRWKVDHRTHQVQKNIPAKTLRYFLIIPRFKRMFESAEKAENLRWHASNKSEDGNMRHPVDSLAWEAIDRKWPSFSADPRNLRLALSTDGVNPFRNLSSTYSCWPVMLITYNLPPWLCMKKEYIMLTMLIPGKKQPGDDIDIFLAPMIEDLLELWERGMQVYDAYTETMFDLKAILMWTISDFPAYGNLAGCTTKGKKACPPCGSKTSSQWLKFSKKTVYMRSRRFTAVNHPFRLKKSWFDGKCENEEKPTVRSGCKVWKEVKNIENDWGKGHKKKKRAPGTMWKKKSIFFTLPYWKHLLLRHNLDVMHIEKNVCESLLNTLVNAKRKSKDGLKSRRDLRNLGIRLKLHPRKRKNRTYLPPAPCTLSKIEKLIFFERLTKLKLPDGYGSNISSCFKIDGFKIDGLKSHDYHVLMQQLLPVVLRGFLPNGARNAIFRLCAFFHQLCQRVLNQEKMEALEDEVAEILCLLERYFPPSFFDIMVHLLLHLPREARLCGPVPFRWMFAFER